MCKMSTAGMKPDPRGFGGGGQAWFPKWTPPTKMSPKYQRIQRLNFKHLHYNLAQGAAETWVWLSWEIFSYFGVVFLPPPPSPANTWFPKQKPLSLLRKSATNRYSITTFSALVSVFCTLLPARSLYVNPFIYSTDVY